jgi:hypothetical protein
MHVEAPDKSAEIARIFSYQDAILVNTSRENGMIWRAAASHAEYQLTRSTLTRSKPN